MFACGGEAASLIAASRVNDDYCDCAAAGSFDDEPGTAACSSQESGGDARFFCGVSSGAPPASVAASRVGDGICDCCDGRDEVSRRAPSISIRSISDQTSAVAAAVFVVC